MKINNLSIKYSSIIQTMNVLLLDDMKIMLNHNRNVGALQLLS